MPDSYIVVSPELLILTASNAYLADTLKRRDELVGRYLFDAFPDNPAAPEANAVRNWRASLELVIATGQPHQMALQHYNVLDPERPGHFVERHWLPRNTPVFDAQGKLHYIIHSSVNVTEEVLARQAMAQAQDRERRALVQVEQERQRLSQLVLQAPAAICLLKGPELVYELVNPGYQRLFAGRQLLGRPLLAAVPEFKGTAVWEHLEQVYRTGQTYRDQEVPVSWERTAGSDSEESYFNHTFQARYNAHGQVDGVYVFAFDVSEQVRARRQVLALNQQLTRVNADLDTFIYTASHDLRAPIANIEGLVNVLRQDLPPEWLRQSTIATVFTLIDNAIARFQQTIGHLTNVMQLQAKSAEPTPAIELATLLEDVRLDLAPSLAAAGAELRIDLAACATVRFPPKDLRSILFNLLSNALKYRDLVRPPVIEVRARCTAEQAVLTVQDNGLGLAPKQQTRLFGLFQRLHTHIEGSGVGLYSIKRLIENAGGTITVQSELGIGSTFTVALPL